VLTLIEARRAEHKARVPCDPLRYVLLDTPGQIEIFTWSASGQIITEQLQLGEHAVLGTVLAPPQRRRSAPRMLPGAPRLPPGLALWKALCTLVERPRLVRAHLGLRCGF
tara:strand:- start:313 stop:642 length:330 start_codon:yes stop_codon:yes gene_type:complete